TPRCGRPRRANPSRASPWPRAGGGGTRAVRSRSRRGGPRSAAGAARAGTPCHQIACWGRQAEVAGQYLQKGKQIYVEGRLQTRSWDDRQTGEKRYRTEVICENFEMLSARGGGGGGEMDHGGGGSSYEEPGGGGFGDPGEDDIPF